MMVVVCQARDGAEAKPLRIKRLLVLLGIFILCGCTTTPKSAPPSYNPDLTTAENIAVMAGLFSIPTSGHSGVAMVPATVGTATGGNVGVALGVASIFLRDSPRKETWEVPHLWAWVPAHLKPSTSSVRRAIKRELDAAAAKTLYGGTVIPRPAMRTPPLGVNEAFEIWATPECPAVNTLTTKSYAPECSGELEVWVVGESYKNLDSELTPPPFVAHTGNVRGPIWSHVVVKDDMLKRIDLKTANKSVLTEFSLNLPRWIFLYIPPHDRSSRSATIINSGISMDLSIPTN